MLVEIGGFPHGQADIAADRLGQHQVQRTVRLGQIVTAVGPQRDVGRTGGTRVADGET